MSLSLAFKDLKKTVTQHRVWLHLGWVEVKQRYRRSILGPWWISLSMFIFILMMGVVFSRLFDEKLSTYIPFFTAGFLFWTLISTSMIEATEIFKINAGFIKQINLPFSLYVFKFIVRQLIFFAHNFVVYLLVCLYFAINPGWNLFLIIPGFILFVINLYWICFVVALVCTRYRDMVPIINSCVQIAFFVTPISWMPRLLDSSSLVMTMNPLVYLLDIVRSPLLGNTPSLSSWTFCGAMALIGCALYFFLFARTRTRIPFWVD